MWASSLVPPTGGRDICSNQGEVCVVLIAVTNILELWTPHTMHVGEFGAGENAKIADNGTVHTNVQFWRHL